MTNNPIANLLKASKKKDGCRLAVSCINPPCPFPKCKEDLKSGQKMETIIRGILTRKLFKQGVSRSFLASLFNVSERTIQGYLKTMRMQLVQHKGYFP